MKDKKEFISEINYNKLAEPCPACATECEKINNRINKRNLSEIKNEEVPHILKVFDF